MARTKRTQPVRPQRLESKLLIPVTVIVVAAVAIAAYRFQTGGAPEAAVDLAPQVAQAENPTEDAVDTTVAHAIQQSVQAEDDDSELLSEEPTQEAIQNEVSAIPAEDFPPITNPSYSRDEARMASEPVDSAWAPTMERVLESVMTSIPAGFDKISIECRTTICRMRMTHLPGYRLGPETERLLSAEMGRVLRPLIEQNLDRIQGFSRNTSLIDPERGPDSEVHTVVYVTGASQ